MWQFCRIIRSCNCAICSARWCWCWACRVIWWKQNRPAVTGVTYFRFRSPTAKFIWPIQWGIACFGLGDETCSFGAFQQHCPLLQLSDVGSADESPCSVEQSTTQSHCRVTFYFTLWFHRDCPRQETQLATDWIRKMFAVFCFRGRLEDSFFLIHKVYNYVVTNLFET